MEKKKPEERAKGCDYFLLKNLENTTFLRFATRISEIFNISASREMVTRNKVFAELMSADKWRTLGRFDPKVKIIN